MKRNFAGTIIALLMATAATACAPTGELEAQLHAKTPEAPSTQDDHSAHGAQIGHDAAPLPAVRWASDAPLREGMRRVRTATEALSHAAHDHLDAAQVQAIAAELEAAVQLMFEQCKLAPEPDAALHPLLARVLQASATLADGQFDAAALAELESVLARYPLLFEDAGWIAG